MGLYESDKEKRKVRDFRIWIRDEETQKTLDFFFLNVEEDIDITLKKFLFVEQYLVGRLEKCEFKKIRKQIRQQEGKAADDIFNYMDIHALKEIPKIQKDNKQLYHFLCVTFYTIAFRNAMQDMMRKSIGNSQVQKTYIEKTLHNMDLFQRFNNVL